MSTCNDKQVILHQIFEGEYHLVVCGDRKNEGGIIKKNKKWFILQQCLHHTTMTVIIKIGENIEALSMFMNPIRI